MAIAKFSPGDPVVIILFAHVHHQTEETGEVWVRGNGFAALIDPRADDVLIRRDWDATPEMP